MEDGVNVGTISLVLCRWDADALCVGQAVLVNPLATPCSSQFYRKPLTVDSEQAFKTMEQILSSSMYHSSLAPITSSCSGLTKVACCHIWSRASSYDGRSCNSGNGSSSLFWRWRLLVDTLEDPRVLLTMMLSDP